MNKTKLTKVDIQDRYYFTAKFVGTRISYGPRGVSQSFEFTNIVDENLNKISSYVRFDDIKSFSGLNLKEGDIVSFRARIVVCQNAEEAQYGWYNPSASAYYRLMNPTKACKLVCPVVSFRTDDTGFHKLVKVKPKSYDYPI